MDRTSAIILCAAVLAILAAAAGAAAVLAFRRREEARYLRAAKNLVQEQLLCYALKPRSLAAPSPRRLMLYLRVNTRPVRRFVFDPAEGVSIGRSANCNICVQDPLVSLQHCRIFLLHNRVVVADNSSANGTCIRRGLFRRCPLRRGQAFVLRTSDRICLGRLVLKVTVFTFDDATM